MEKAFKLKFKSGNSIEIHMNNSKCELSIDNNPSFSLSLVNSELVISKVSNSDHEIISKEEINFEKPTNDIIPLRKCIDCNGTQYCITNGCANTPCGWICD